MKFKDIKPGVAYFYCTSNTWDTYPHHSDGKIVLAEEGRWVQPWKDPYSRKGRPEPRPAEDRDGNDWGVLVWHTDGNGNRERKVVKPLHVRGLYDECMAQRTAARKEMHAGWDAERAERERKQAVVAGMAAIGITDAALHGGMVTISPEQAAALTAALSAINWTYAPAN